MQLHQILTEMLACFPARRGKLFEQYVERTASDGTVKRMGPYYVLTRSVNGKTVSERIKATDAPRVQLELNRGENLSKLMEKIWEQAEEMAQNAMEPKKKLPSVKLRKQP